MKAIKALCVLTLFSIASIFANDKPQRFSDDPKIFAYAMLKDPASFYTKLVKFTNEVYPGSGAMIEQQSAPFKFLIDGAVSIQFVMYGKEKFEEQPHFVLLLTVKDKGLLKNPLIDGIPNKEIVDNTLLFSQDSEGIAKCKPLLKSLATLKTQKDIEFVVDIKNMVKAAEAKTNAEAPYLKDLLAQLDIASIGLNIADKGLESSFLLAPTDKSNLQIALTQPAADNTSLLKFVGQGNFMSSISSYDTSKLKNLSQDVFKALNSIPNLTEDNKKLLKTIEPLVSDFLSIGIISDATSASYKDALKMKSIFKVKDPAAVFSKMNAILKQISNENFTKIMDTTELKGLVSFQFQEVEKINGQPVYKLTNSAKDANNVIAKQANISNDIYYTIDQNYIYSAADIASLKEMIEAVKNAPKTEATLESFNFYKAGQSSYVDFYIDGYIKLIQTMFGNMGLNIGTASGLKLPPIKICGKADGNVSAKAFLETSTIAALVAKVQEAIMNVQQNMGGGNDEGGDEMQPAKQP